MNVKTNFMIALIFTVAIHCYFLSAGWFDLDIELEIEQPQEELKVEYEDFTRNKDVVIVTKIHGILHRDHLNHFRMWLCLVSHSYNDKANHDIVIFTTIPWEKEQVETLQKIAAPSNLIVAIDGPPLEEQLASMSPSELELLRFRCGIDDTSTENLTWFHHCAESGARYKSNLAYAWQAEFRSLHIWNHPALLKYKYMIWFDTDCKMSGNWQADPIKAMVKNDLTLLYVGFPYGAIHRDANLANKLMKHYNTSICSVDSNAFGVHAKPCNSSVSIFMVAGNHHITNMQVFRKDIHQQFLKDLYGEYRFGRMYDDQLAVTIVSVMEQYLANENVPPAKPKKHLVWHEARNGMEFYIAHHNFYDANRRKTRSRAPMKHECAYEKHKVNWTGVEERCGAFFTACLHD